MKRNLFYLLPLLLALGAACSPKGDSTPIPQPQGTFKGSFGALVKKASGAGYDTIRDTALIINLTANSRFTVTGDTIKHAASKGSFAYNGVYIQFNDSSKVVTGTGAKFHLKGVYQYGYNGTVFQLQRLSNGDTSNIVYNFKKIN
jgi:hypothetical protein